VTNTPAYYNTSLITAVKRFKVHDPGRNLSLEVPMKGKIRMTLLSVSFARTNTKIRK
jgi:hypothetical protein